MTALLSSIAEEEIGLASITVWEILNGIGRRAPGRRRNDLAEWFRDLLDELFQDRIVDWTLADTQVCARIMKAKRRRREPLDYHLPDTILAVTAACHGVTVVTQNASEFRDTGVEFVDPWATESR